MGRYVESPAQEQLQPVQADEQGHSPRPCLRHQQPPCQQFGPSLQANFAQASLRAWQGWRQICHQFLRQSRLRPHRQRPSMRQAVCLLCRVRQQKILPTSWRLAGVEPARKSTHRLRQQHAPNLAPLAQHRILSLPCCEVLCRCPRKPESLRPHLVAPRPRRWPLWCHVRRQFWLQLQPLPWLRFRSILVRRQQPWPQCQLEQSWPRQTEQEVVEPAQQGT